MRADVIQLASDLIRIPSVTESEFEILEFLSTYLVDSGFNLEKIRISEKRYNIFAYRGSPEICFTTHVDTVPGLPSQFIPKLRDGKLFGRGACDTKGIIASMLIAANHLPAESSLSFLFVVGEETDGIGAKLAASELKNRGIKFCVNGEPTEGKLALGHKGGLSFSLETRGRSCHSGYPELGEDANAKMFSLIEELSQFNGIEKNKVLGKSTINFGIIKGGVANNVLSDSCYLEAQIRVVNSAAKLKEKLHEIVGDRALIHVSGESEPVSLVSLDGFETMVASYCSDIPYLLDIGAKFLMYGPGSIIHAHTESEHIEIEDLELGVTDFIRIYESLRS